MDTKLSTYDDLLQRLKNERYTWLITGVAGFIGSNLLETLLKLDQKVIGLDNFSTGYQKNLDEVQSLVSIKQWGRFNFIEGDIRNLEDCQLACTGVEFVLHQAALGSVPRSIEDPIKTNSVNISGYLNMLVASRDAQVKRFIYAASSSTYGDHPDLPKIEDRIGKPLSPYAVTKFVNELYADVFVRTYGLESIGLRYFNVFGGRQDPKGAYAAVIPKWVASMIQGQEIYINGDGETSRDFCFVENVVQANLLSALSNNKNAINQIYNVSAGNRITLNELFINLKQILSVHGIEYERNPTFIDFRNGDIRHSQADIGKIIKLLSYGNICNAYDGLVKTVPWYVSKCLNNDSLQKG